MKTNAIPMVMVALIGIFIFALIVSAETVEGSMAHPLRAIAVTPDWMSLEIGETQQFEAKGYDKDGNEIPITPLWITTGGKIDPGGLYTATQEGDFTVTASVDDSDVTGSADVHVTLPGLFTIEVMPHDAVMIACWEAFILSSYIESLQFNAKGYDKDGNEIPITPTWSADGGEITPDGLYTPTEEGDFTVTASVDDSDVTGSADVHVTLPGLFTIEVMPHDAVMIACWEAFILSSYIESLQFNAKGYDKDGNEIPITPTWSADGGEITPDGLYTPTEEGDYTVTASVDDSDVTGSATVHVIPPELDTIEVTLGGVTHMKIGETHQFEATGYDEDGNEIEISPWWLTTGGEITPGGRYTATEVGGFTVTVSVDDSDVTGSADVFVVELKPPELAGPPSYDFAGPSHPGPLPYDFAGTPHPGPLPYDLAGTPHPGPLPYELVTPGMELIPPGPPAPYP